MTSFSHTFNTDSNNNLETFSGAEFLEKFPQFKSVEIIKSPPYDNEVTVTTSYSYSTLDTMTTTDPVNFYTLNELRNEGTEVDTKKSQKRDLLFDIPINSSQDSSFEGFSSSPIGKLHRLFYSANCEQHEPENKNSDNNSRQSIQKLSPGKLLFSKFYDTIVEENSCNAVDMQMSNSLPTRKESIESYNSHNSDINPSSDLSFNGKIKSLNLNQNTTHNSRDRVEHTGHLTSFIENSLNNSQQFTESFILKKYSNEKSPDLFGDDDDDDPNNEEMEADNKHAVLNATQPPVISCNLAENSFNCPTESSFANDDHTIDCSLTQGASGNTSSDSYTLFKDNCQREREMLRRIRKCLAGVLPPPSVTIPQLDMASVVVSKKDDIINFINDIKVASSKQIESADGEISSTSRPSSLLKPTHTLDETKSMSWRNILSVRQHGLCYNLNKASENNEYLSLSVVERFIGAETASSYMNSPSSAKKRNTRLKLICQSPGNRLSHLAKRRAIFSSANLATQKTHSLVGPQILLDKKKIKNRRKATPKRMTPGSKKKNRKTPTSSASNAIVKPGPSRESSKRALFQSPAKHVQQTAAAAAKPPAMKPELANRVEKSKRALLFSPEKKQQQQTVKNSLSSTSYFAPSTTTPLDMLLKRKRDHCDDYDDVDTSDLASQSSKLFKADGSAYSLTPRALKIKSQSFCIGTDSSTTKHKQLPCASHTFTKNSNMSLSSTGSNSSQQQFLCTNSVSSLLVSKLQKSYSDNAAPTNSLTENQKKKLLWAVSQALQERKITTKHESFKQFASILARVVRRIFQEFYQKNSTSNSETLLRLAKKYAYPVTAGSSADDIYLQAKTQIEESKRQSSARLSGYIGPEEYQQLKQQSSVNHPHSHKGSMNNIFTTENSFDSFGLISQTSSGFCGSTNSISMLQTSFLDQVSQDVVTADSTQNSNSRSATKIIPATSLQNSSSKSNLCGVVLRENVDCETRRSAQKNFTGKDQRNMSPYAGGNVNNNNGSAVKIHTQLITDITANTTKARRQISFDS